MRLLVLVLMVLAVGVWIGIWIGFTLGFSRAMREAAGRLQTTKRPVMAWASIISGCVFLVLAAGAALYSWHFINKAERTTGKVIELIERVDKDGDRTYAPTFSFRDSLGVEHTVTASVSSYPPQYRIGEAVPVLYLGESPKRARIESYSHLWGLPTVAGIMGALSLAIGLLVLFWSRIATKFKQAT